MLDVVELLYGDKHGLFGSGVPGLTGDLPSAESVILSNREADWEAEIL